MCDKNKICGRNYGGRNYGGITCESCKKFFFRNALNNKTFVCPSGGRCKITPVTRKYCQKCRIERCFSIGMKKEYLKTYETIDRDVVVVDNETNEDVIQISDNSVDSSLITESINESQLNCENYSKEFEGLNELECNRISELMRASNVFHSGFSQTTPIYATNIRDELNKLFLPRTDPYIKSVFERIHKYLSGRPVVTYKGLLFPTYYDSETKQFTIHLLMAIIIFNPNRPHLIHRHNVKLEQQFLIFPNNEPNGIPP
ncbi:unnamed protein product [Oppiella nova]|uniref:Nuclear receptor domain-containing protein n=1 Tax=Oppiella nova TaxID=334625 RepID=A0A7R9QFD6_9ACAR|nr:unnamed protein product [Oppiella nova]CAG2163906.1 unnamed protein product [Oppiella nova]